MNDPNAAVLDKIVSIVSRQVKGKVKIDEDTVLQEDVGLSSLQIMELIFEIEEEFDISFPLNRLPDIQTVKELSAAIIAVLEQ